MIVTVPQTRVLDAVPAIDDRKRRRSVPMGLPQAMREAMQRQSRPA